MLRNLGQHGQLGQYESVFHQNKLFELLLRQKLVELEVFPRWYLYLIKFISLSTHVHELIVGSDFKLLYVIMATAQPLRQTKSIIVSFPEHTIQVNFLPRNTCQSHMRSKSSRHTWRGDGDLVARGMIQTSSCFTSK